MSVGLDHPEFNTPLPNSDDPFAAKRAEIDAALAKFMEGADVYEQRGELDDDTAERANDYINGAKRLLKEAEAASKEEQAPHKQAAAAVAATWAPIISRLERVIDVLRPLFKRHLDRKAEEQRKAAEEAARRRREAEAAARAAEADALAAETASQRIAAEERAAEQARIADQAAHAVAKASEPVRVGSATGLSNRRGYKTVWKVKIVSLAQALSHYRNEPAVRELIEKLAARDMREAPVRAGKKQIPRIGGVEFIETKELNA